MRNVLCSVAWTLVMVSVCPAQALWSIKSDGGRTLKHVTLVERRGDSLVVSDRSADRSSSICINSITGVDQEVETILPGLFAGTAGGALIGYFIGSSTESSPVNGVPAGNGATAGALVGGAGGGLVGALVSEMLADHHDLRGMTAGERALFVDSLLTRDATRTAARPAEQQPDSVPHLEQSAGYTLTLRDGSVIKCRRFDYVSDSILSVQLANGELWRFSMSEFANITPSSESWTADAGGKRVASAPAADRAFGTPVRSSPSPNHFCVTAFASLCPPVGAFASRDVQNGGGATLGYGFGLEIAIPIDSHNSWIVSGAMQFYGFEMPAISGVSMDNGSWHLILPMTGPRVSVPLSGDARVFGEAMIGWDFQNSPEMNLGVAGYSLTMPSASSGALAYAIGGGVVFGDLVQLRVRYIDGGSPDYNVSAFVALQSIMYTVKQPTGAFEISLGVIL